MIFHGTKIFPDWRLTFHIYSQEGEFYNADILKEDLRRLQDFYIEKTYYKAVIGPAVVAYNETTNEVVIQVSIQAKEKIDLITSLGAEVVICPHDVPHDHP